MEPVNVELKGNYYEKYLIEIEDKLNNEWSLHGIHHRHLNAAIQNELLKLPEGSKVLDGGCGLSIWLTPEIERKIEYFGVDCQKESIEFCQKRFPKRNYSLEDLYKLNFEDNFFDAVVMREVIEHFITPEKAVAEVCRVLKPGGVFILTTPNYANPLLHIIEHTYNRFFGGPCKPYLPDVHPSKFTHAKLMRLLTDKFRTVDVSSIDLRINLVAVSKSVVK